MPGARSHGLCPWQEDQMALGGGGSDQEDRCSQTRSGGHSQRAALGTARVPLPGDSLNLRAPVPWRRYCCSFCMGKGRPSAPEAVAQGPCPASFCKAVFLSSLASQNECQCFRPGPQNLSPPHLAT